MNAPPTARLGRRAAADVRGILRHTLRRFGTAQRASYAQLLTHATRLIAESPYRPGSVDCAELLPGLRSFPVWLAARRRGSSPHILFYRRDGTDILIVRIQHDSMSPDRHIATDADE